MSRMRKIESVKKKGKYYAVTADGAEYRGITAEAIAECKIKCGEIAEKDFFSFVALNDYYRAKQYLFDMLARKPRTLKEAERKLREKKFLPESICKSVALATEYGYISDGRYAEDYVETGSRTKGAYRLKAELRKKGVSSEHIERALGRGRMRFEARREEIEKGARRKGYRKDAPLPCGARYLLRRRQARRTRSHKRPRSFRRSILAEEPEAYHQRVIHFLHSVRAHFTHFGLQPCLIYRA